MLPKTYTPSSQGAASEGALAEPERLVLAVPPMFRVLTVASLTASLWTCGTARLGREDAGSVSAKGGGGPGAGGSATGGGGSSATVRFVAIGDTGKGNPGQHQVGAAIGAHCATHGCDFVVLLGDNFYPSGVTSTADPQWQTAFVVPYAPVNAPFYAVLGNHDYGADGLGTDLPRAEHQVAYSLVNPKWRMPAHHYKFRLADAEFFVGDTNLSMFNLDTAARADFVTWLPASTALWKIVFAHHPYKSNGKHGIAGSYDGNSFIPVVNGAGVKSFVEERVCGQADFYFSGHDHNLQWLEATCTRPDSPLHTQLIISGGGATTTPLVGTMPAHYQSDALGFVYVVISGRTLTASFHDADGTQQYVRSATK